MSPNQAWPIMNTDPRPRFQAWVCLITFDQEPAYSTVNLIDKTPEITEPGQDLLQLADCRSKELPLDQGLYCR